MGIRVGREGLLKWEREQSKVEIPYREGSWKEGTIRYIESEDMFAVVFDNGLKIELGDGQNVKYGGKSYLTDLR